MLEILARFMHSCTVLQQILIVCCVNGNISFSVVALLSDLLTLTILPFELRPSLGALSPFHFCVSRLVAYARSLRLVPVNMWFYPSASFFARCALYPLPISLYLFKSTLSILGHGMPVLFLI